jgi:AraC family transcriptional regulator of adaptative response / DNA-3-methyladenine glycosylase II
VTTLRLSYRPPYAWEEMLAYLAGRAIPGVEEVGGGEYRRTIRIRDRAARLAVRPVPESNQVLLTLDAPVRHDLIDVVERVRRVFDLGADPLPIAARLGRSPALRAAVRRRPGLRVPGAWDPFEVAVRAILGQQVSVKGATTLAGRLAERWGEPVRDAGSPGPHLLFPAAEVLARARVERIGLPGARARAIRGLAARVADGSLPLAWGECAEDTERRLVAIPGIGDWTAQYVALRALGEPDVFLPGDLGVRRALADADGKMPSPRDAAARAEAWRPWRSYAVLHLWSQDSNGRKKR